VVGVILGSQEAERPLGNEHLIGCPAFEGKPPSEAAQCTLLSVPTGETDSNHDVGISLPLVGVGFGL
jgi:hypothetical protein